MASEPAEGLQALLEYLKSTRAFDFTGYKTASIERRLAKRLEALRLGSYGEYLDYLEVHPDEFAALFNTILINVTSFFRDGDAWDFLRSDVVPRMIEVKDADAGIRIWSAGCASGEEPYSMAIVLAEALGLEEYVRRVKIYATDVDEDALEHARAGSYEPKKLEGVPEVLRDTYFDRLASGRMQLDKDLRRTVIFGRNDLVQDAPISRVDLLLCRNTLMYFNAETQSHILRRFHFALQQTGFLFLGKSEMLLTRSELFAPVNLRRRVFSKVALPSRMDRHADPFPARTGAPAAARTGTLQLDGFEIAPTPQIVVDAERTLVAANLAARTLLHLSEGDIGRPLKDLEASYRPVELRRSVDQVLEERQPVTLDPLEYSSGGEPRATRVTLVPLPAPGRNGGVSIAFVDISAEYRLRKELQQTKAELGAAYEELQSTVEELETTNEELQSTNEELETTNEELETMNEELQSSNEELETTNEELRVRSTQLNEANAFMETILASMGIGVIVLDREQRVRIWNRSSEDLWGVRANEAAGTHILELDFGLPVEALQSALRAVARDEAETQVVEVQATDRRGRGFVCEVTVVPLAIHGDDRSTIILARRNGAVA